jgi:hypothetical protein
MNRKYYSVLVSVCALLVLVTTLPAIAGDDGGPPDGKGNRPKDDIGKSVEGFLYGDLYVIERDGNGEPFLYGAETSCHDGDTGIACAQPLRADCSYVPLVCSTFSGVTSDDWGDQLDTEIPGLDPLLPNTLGECLAAYLSIHNPLDPENGWEPGLCDLHPCFLDTVQEVHFGRMSVVRSTPEVVDKAYDEALSSLNSALGVSQDLAGRIVLDLPLLDEFDEPVYDGENIVTYAKTIDSPLENLALYREMMVNECLGTVDVKYIGEGGGEVEEIHYLEQGAINLLMEYAPDLADPNFRPLKPLVCPYDDPSDLTNPTTPDLDGDPGDHNLAAVFLAAAADKGGHVTLDMVINANTYVGVNRYDEPDQGQAPILTYHEFVADSDTGWYEYNQASAYHYAASATLLMPSADCGGGDCYCVGEVSPFGAGPEYVDFVNSSVPVCRGGQLLRANYSENPSAPLHFCRQDVWNYGLDTLLSIGENSVEPGCGGANWFTQAAEDAREVIWFLHNWKIPEYEAPVP